MQPEKRGVRRFAMNLPVRLMSSGAGSKELPGYTRDVSSRGAFLEIDVDLIDGAPVEFLMTLPSEITLAEPIRVRCHGRVLRTEQNNGSRGVAVAIDQYDFLSRDN